MDGWKDDPDVKLQDNWRLKGMLFNNEWQIDEDAVITFDLLSKLLFFGDFPKNFEEKMNYLTLKFYQNGGAEYKEQRVDDNNYLFAYADGAEEYNRIIAGLKSKNFIKMQNQDSNSITLTEEGVTHAQKLLKRKNEKEPSRYIENKVPRVMMISLVEDKANLIKLRDYLLSYGIATIVMEDITDDDGMGSMLHNARANILNGECDYVIFIKSDLSDRNNSFGSILDIAIEAHVSTERKRNKFIYLAYVDDSSYKKRPRLYEYRDTDFDIRITNNRKRLARDIENDWASRTSSKPVSPTYNFPTIYLNENEKLWLNTLYDKFIKNEKIDYSSLLSKMWKHFPKDFEPAASINPHILRGGTRLTLWGIWHINSESDLLEKYDKVVFAVKDILNESGIPDSVLSEDVQLRLPTLSEEDIFKAFSLMSESGFGSGIGSNNDNFSCSISLRSTEVINEYRNYEGLQSHMNEYFKKNKKELSYLIKTLYY